MCATIYAYHFNQPQIERPRRPWRPLSSQFAMRNKSDKNKKKSVAACSVAPYSDNVCGFQQTICVQILYVERIFILFFITGYLCINSCMGLGRVMFKGTINWGASARSGSCFFNQPLFNVRII